MVQHCSLHIVVSLVLHFAFASNLPSSTETVRRVEVSPGVSRVIPANLASIGVSADGNTEKAPHQKVTVESLNRQVREQTERKIAQESATGEILPPPKAHVEASAAKGKDPSLSHSPPNPFTPSSPEASPRKPPERKRRNKAGWMMWMFFVVIGAVAAWVAYRRIKLSQRSLTSKPPPSKTPLQQKAALLRRLSVESGKDSTSETGSESVGTATSEEAAQIYARVQKSLEHLKLAGKNGSRTPPTSGPMKKSPPPSSPGTSAAKTAESASSGTNASSREADLLSELEKLRIENEKLKLQK